MSCTVNVLPNLDFNSLQADEKRLIERITLEKTFDVSTLNLSAVEQKIYDQNPHLREVFVNKRPFIVSKEPFNGKNRFLSSIHGRLKESSLKLTPGQVHTVDHWGRRKLIMAYIDFLTEYGQNANTLVVSAGAAPGGHWNYLSKLFPHLSFDLIDSAEFAVSATDRIHLRQELFNDMLAHEYAPIAKTRPVLFECDIRTQFTGSWDEFDEGVKRDMDDQMRWHLIIKPQASMLKFRLPFEQGSTTYLKGELKLQLWAPRRGTECRLIVDRRDEMQMYDHQELDAAMAHFKNIERTTYYPHDMDDAEGIDHCYDCRAELFVLEQYVRQIEKNNQDEEVRERVKQLSKDISCNIQQTLRPPIIDTPRTLAIIPKK
ncbi:hypothetical protein I4U23_011430 [Adineta vaga]|nr:hypothetical protein I4U23_011430 [Adineta vaga]